MSRSDHRWWPTNMQLVLVTSNGPEPASTYVEAIDDLAASVRDVVDEWFELCDDQPGITLLDELDGLSARIEGMRRALFVVRQWEVPDDE